MMSMRCGMNNVLLRPSRAWQRLVARPRSSASMAWHRAFSTASSVGPSNLRSTYTPAQAQLSRLQQEQQRQLTKWGATRTLAALKRRLLHTTPPTFASGDGGSEKVRVVFKDASGGEQECYARVGQNLLDIAIDNDIDLEGACGGTLACSTCHLVIDKKWFGMLEEPEDEELDMLDLAFGLTDTSRLGCQIQVTPELDGIEVTLPDEQSDARGS